MSTKISLLFLVIVIFFSSCSKSGNSGYNGNTGGGNPPSNFLTHTVYFIQNNSSGGFMLKQGQVFEYDKPNNTLTIYQNDTTTTGKSIDTIVCKLNGDVITQFDKLDLVTKSYYLNKGHTYPDSLVILSGTTKIDYAYVYTFDANNKVTSIKQTQVIYTNGNPSSPQVQTTNLTLQNGNLVRSANAYDDYTYTFDVNVLAAAPDPQLMLYNPTQNIDFSKNIIKTSNFTFLFNNTSDAIVYTYDDKGRVVKSNATLSADGSTSQNIITYY